MGQLVATGQITIVDTNDYLSTGSVAPPNPVAGVTLWCDTTVEPNQIKKWNGATWEIVNEVKIGGRNLFQQSKTFLSPWAVTGAIRTLESDGSYSLNIVNSWVNYARYDIDLALNSELVISFYAKAAASVILEIKNDSLDNYPLGYATISSTNWARYTVKIKITKRDYLPVICFLARQSVTTINLKQVKLEFGNIVTDYTEAPEDVQARITATNTLIANAVSDTILSAGTEKSQQLQLWNAITGEYQGLLAQGNTYGSTKTAGYTTVFNALGTYLNGGTAWTWANGTVPLWLGANLAADTTGIVPATYQTKWSDYYNAKIALQNDLYALASKKAADDIQVGGRNLMLNTSSSDNSWVPWAGATYMFFSSNVLISSMHLKELDAITFSCFVNIVGFANTYSINVVAVINGVTQYYGIKTGISNNSKGVGYYTIPAGCTTIGFYISFVALAANNTVIYNSLKLEKGNKATDWSPAPEDITALISTAQTSANTANTAVSALNTYVDGAFKDGVITNAESVSIEKYKNQVTKDTNDLISGYNVIYANSYLTGTAKTDLLNAKVTMYGAKDNLITSINSAIADGKTTVAEKADVDAKFALWDSAIAAYKGKLELANKAIQINLDAIGKGYADAVQIGGRNLVIKSTSNQSILPTVFTEGLSKWGGVIPFIHQVFGFVLKSLTANQDYTISFRAWCASGAATLHNDLYPNMATIGTFVLNTTPTVYSWLINTSTADVTDCPLRFYLETFVSNVYVTDIQVESGNRITSYKPSPEDVEASIVDAVDGIQIGGTNHCLNSEAERTFGAMEIGKIVGFVGGESVMLSFWGNYVGTQALAIVIYNGGTGVETGTEVARLNVNNGVSYDRKSMPVTLPANLDNLRVVGWIAGTGTGTGKAKKFKVELGNKVTDWSAATEDTQTAVVDAKTAAQDNIAIKMGYTDYADMVAKAAAGLSLVEADGMFNVDLINVNNLIALNGFIQNLVAANAFIEALSTVNLNVTGTINANQGIFGLMKIIGASIIGDHLKITNDPIETKAVATAAHVYTIPYITQQQNFPIGGPSQVMETNEVLFESDTVISAFLRNSSAYSLPGVYTDNTYSGVGCSMSFMLEVINNGVVVASNTSNWYAVGGAYTNSYTEGAAIAAAAISKGKVKLRSTVYLNNPQGWDPTDYLIVHPIITSSSVGNAANITFSANIYRSMLGIDGLFSYTGANRWMYYRGAGDTNDEFEVNMGGNKLGYTPANGWNIPAGKGGASISAAGVVVTWWGIITAANQVAKSGSNYTITHNIGNTNYSIILTPKSTSVPYFLDANRLANSIVVTCAGGFDFVLIRTQ